jgi:hypothetical protein
MLGDLHMIKHQMKEGNVTARGIYYGGYYYSCQYALRNQWFELADEQGSWTIAVTVDENSAILYIEVDEQQLRCERLTTDPSPSSDLNTYYETMQHLQKEMKSRKRRVKKTL